MLFQVAEQTSEPISSSWSPPLDGASRAVFWILRTRCTFISIFSFGGTTSTSRLDDQILLPFPLWDKAMSLRARASLSVASVCFATSRCTIGPSYSGPYEEILGFDRDRDGNLQEDSLLSATKEYRVPRTCAGKRLIGDPTPGRLSPKQNILPDPAKLWWHSSPTKICIFNQVYNSPEIWKASWLYLNYLSTCWGLSTVTLSPVYNLVGRRVGGTIASKVMGLHCQAYKGPG